MDQEIEQAMQVLWEYLVIRDQPTPCDAIFVFGSGQIKVPRYAAQLYREGMASQVVVSGALGPLSAHLFQGKAEHEVFTKELIAHGVPRERILVETRATNTSENILFGMEQLRRSGCAPRRMILVSTPQHMRRCVATFQKKEPQIEIISCPPEGAPLEFVAITPERFLWILVSEVERLVHYGEKEYLLIQDIPQTVMEAVEIIKREVPQVDLEKL